MYFVLGSIVICFSGFFGYVAKQINVGTEKHKSLTAREPQSSPRRSVS
jgi:hypothetical protein